MEGRGVHKRHRPGSTESPRLYPRDDRGHRRLLSARAAQTRMRAHPLRAGGDLPRARCWRIPSCDRRSAGPARLHGVPGGKPQRRARRNYRAQKAEERASKRARRPKRCLLAIDDRLRDLVAAKLEANWSPQQISGWLKREYPSDEAMRVSHETIYRTLFVQARGALKRELLAHLRSRRMMRRSRRASTRGQPRGQIKEAVSIRERPPEAEDRALPGHWEGDLLAGSRNTHVATLVERSSRFVMLVWVDGKDTESVVRALGEQIRRLPKTMMATLTWDRGPEMAAHKSFTVATDVSVYFCDPKSPWQRGTSENTNRLLRQYLPRKTDLSVYDQADLDLIALKLNTRPRKTLGYSTPAATLATTVALTS